LAVFIFQFHVILSEAKNLHQHNERPFAGAQGDKKKVVFPLAKDAKESFWAKCLHQNERKE